MGYRNYFYLVENEVIEKVSKYTLETLPTRKDGTEGDEGDWLGPYDLIGDKTVHEFGKLYYCDTAERIYAKSKPLFEDKAVDDRYDEYACAVVGKEGVLEAIECYREKITKYLKEDLEINKELDSARELTDIKIEVVVPFVRSQLSAIRLKYEEMKTPYDPKFFEENGFMEDSWIFENSRWNLIMLYHTLNWNKYSLVFMGH